MYQQGRGRVETTDFVLSGTGANEVLAIASSENGTLIEHIRLVNTTGSAIDVTVDRYDVANSKAHVLVQEHSLAAKSSETTDGAGSKSVYEIVMPMWLDKNWKLRVTGNSDVHVCVTHVRPEGRT